MQRPARERLAAHELPVDARAVPRQRVALIPAPLLGPQLGLAREVVHRRGRLRHRAWRSTPGASARRYSACAGDECATRAALKHAVRGACERSTISATSPAPASSLRAEFNVPMRADGEVADDTRLRLTLPTIAALRERGARVLLVAHLGRPRDREPSLSLRPVAARLAQLLGEDVAFAPDLEHVADGDVVMLENIRFEARGDRQRSGAGGAARRACRCLCQRCLRQRASRQRLDGGGRATTSRAPRPGGCSSARSRCCESVLRSPARPLVAVLGGAKVTDKIGVIERLLELADTLLIGGAMSYPFLAAQGHGVGDSLCDAEGVADRAARCSSTRAAACTCRSTSSSPITSRRTRHVACGRRRRHRGGLDGDWTSGRGRARPTPT